MVYQEDEAKLYLVESKIEGPILRGIVHQPQGRSSALIGIDIYYEGDQVDEWTVKEISKNTVILEKSDGEKLELKMENR